jgi:hypothetical protein
LLLFFFFLSFFFFKTNQSRGKSLTEQIYIISLYKIASI